MCVLALYIPTIYKVGNVSINRLTTFVVDETASNQSVLGLVGDDGDMPKQPLGTGLKHVRGR